MRGGEAGKESEKRGKGLRRQAISRPEDNRKIKKGGRKKNRFEGDRFSAGTASGGQKPASSRKRVGRVARGGNSGMTS